MIANVNQDVQSNILYAQETLQDSTLSMTRATIKNSLGEEVFIDWGDEQSTLRDTNKVVATSNQVMMNSYYGVSTKGALTLQNYVGGKVQKNGCWVNATASEIEKYMVPSTYNINTYKQHWFQKSTVLKRRKNDRT